MPSTTRPSPDNSGRNAMIVLVLGLIVMLVGGAWWWRATDPAAPPTPPAPAAPAATTAPAAEAPPAGPRRVRVPRPAPSTPAAPRAPTPPAPTNDAATATDGLADRPPAPPSDADAVRELLMQQMKDVTADLLPCVERWTATDPSLNGEVLVRFAMDADGLTDVWIEDHETVPDGMLDCFADGVYGKDWAGITREPLEVSWPIKVSAG